MKTRFLKTLIVLFLVVTTPSLAQDEELRSLRDEAIKNIGWVAGNSYGHPIWPEIKPFVGKGGSYYEFYLRLAPKNSDHAAEAFYNVSLYEEWFEIGSKQPFNENEGLSRIQRVMQIQDELGKLFDRMEAEQN